MGCGFAAVQMQEQRKKKQRIGLLNGPNVPVSWVSYLFTGRNQPLPAATFEFSYPPTRFANTTLACHHLLLKTRCTDVFDLSTFYVIIFCAAAAAHFRPLAVHFGRLQFFCFAALISCYLIPDLFYLFGAESEAGSLHKLCDRTQEFQYYCLVLSCHCWGHSFNVGKKFFKTFTHMFVDGKCLQKRIRNLTLVLLVLTMVLFWIENTTI